ncbi:MAG: MotA/TolQ/ExbB proton channel family protein [Verrucomicrobiae bacterium]|nr:MotA/TolQ/ExbB proton channel family protein [Verrucomicrobiae bacterium]
MIHRFVSESAALFHEGGWVLCGLLCLAFGIAFALISLWRAMQLPYAPVLSQQEWRHLLDRRGEEPVPGALASLRAALGDDVALTGRLEEIDRHLFAVPERRFPFVFVLIGAAPLLGLLGTVTGMFTTFDGMSGAVGSAPVDVISEGVSEALITTQAGLVIAVPSFIVCTLLKGRFDRLRLAYRRIEPALLQAAP